MASLPSYENKIRIVRDAPPPPTEETRGRKTKHPGLSCRTRYPWAELQVGDAYDIPLNSFVAPPGDRWPEYNRVTATISQRHKKYPERYLARMMDDFRVRVWRIA